LPVTLPARTSKLLCALGVVVAVVLLLVPVGTDFSGHPLLRLRQLDPELSPPAPTARCGRPLAALRDTAGNTTLYELARADACREAARRRVAVAFAAGGVILVAGLLGLFGDRVPFHPAQRAARAPAAARPTGEGGDERP
jgi:hypothetical protein